ncbi:MAG TPA: hypothetical protein VEU74_12055 [Gemmatimonadales bacterium]|nr:hypothetical protein [Gemmatimonadales bacterium]
MVAGISRPTDAGATIFGATAEDAEPAPGAVRGGFSQTGERRTAAPQLVNVYHDMPPLRADPFTPDQFDGKRREWNLRMWRQQDHALRRRDRDVEENIRMLAGQQWTVWNPWLQKFMDVSEWMTDDERRWRQRPVINRMLYWYILTHARLTENPPILTFQPSNADRLSADLAEVQDTVFKSKWRELGMPATIADMVAWLIPGGRAYIQSVLDAKGGPTREFRGDAVVPVMQLNAQTEDWEPVTDAAGAPVHQLVRGKVGFSRDGTPVSHLTPNGQIFDREQPHKMPEGDIRCDVLSPVQVRGEWGPKPWHQKRWHMVRSYMTPEEVWEMFGVVEQGETPSVSVATSDPGFLQRLFFGSGYYGAASDKPGSEWATMPTRESFVEVYTRWESPSAFTGTEHTDESPGGRLLITTKRTVLRDGPRPIDYRSASGIRCFDFVNLPGRPSGTTPAEMIKPLQRSYNRFYAYVFENATLHANPIGIIDQFSGLGQVEMTNKPGERFVVMRRQGVPAFEYVQPPAMGRDVYQALSLLKEEMQDLGHMEGAEGRAPTPDPSGKLIKELRFNSDRFLGPTARGMVEEIVRLADDWTAILKVCWDEEKVISYTGQDSVPRTVSVYPEMFTRGATHVIADVESMLPQSRAERQSQITMLYTSGIFGQPGSPGAVQKFLEMARFPHIGRTAWPGGVHVTTAQQATAKLLEGVPAEQIPVFEWYDNTVWIAVLEEFMSGPYYLRIPPPVQQQFALLRQMHQNAQQAKALKQAVQQQRLAGAVAAHGAITARTAAKVAGVPDPTQGVQGDAMSANEQGTPPGAGAGEE